uniref:Uncharacterized protein n=1 Tax=Anguilla anguilla TaxID=7936 RepID=A0A0E9T2I7_ANGAN
MHPTDPVLFTGKLWSKYIISYLLCNIYIINGRERLQLKEH